MNRHGKIARPQNQRVPVTILKDPKELEGFAGSLRKQAQLRTRLILFETGNRRGHLPGHSSAPFTAEPSHETVAGVIGILP